MTTTYSLDKASLQLCLGKRLLDRAQANGELPSRRKEIIGMRILIESMP
jgi:hypothetical protein